VFNADTGQEGRDICSYHHRLLGFTQIKHRLKIMKKGYRLDLIVENQVILEFKSADPIAPVLKHNC
jgi:hypothetical protein